LNRISRRRRSVRALSSDSTNSAAPVAVTFARPEESGAFRKKLGGVRKGKCGTLPAWRGSVGKIAVTVVHTGIGPASAERAMRELLADESPRRVISAGFAGGLDPALRATDTLTADFPTPLIFSKAIPLETPAEKIAAFRETGARIVDMESDVIAAACASAGIPLTSVRAVSDSADESLPVPFGVWFDTARQRARPLALVAHLLRHPSHIAPFARFVLRLPRVAEKLAQAVEAALR
jgi:adenosylhomocysteine nucleosidase